MNTIETLESPFKHLVMTIGELPTTFVESMSYYETIAWLVDYIKNKVIPPINNNAEAIKEIQAWISTLDLQDEVDNKLDEMAESGQLAEIIAQYLTLNGVLSFNTIADMKAAENIVSGSVCKTLGNTSYLDGKGALYKIREITNADVIDNVHIIPITNSGSLIAELIPNTNGGELQEQINQITHKKYIFMGDSYGDGYSPDGDTTSWITLLVNKLNLQPSDYISTHGGGYGFSTGRSTYNYINLLQNLSSDDELTDMYVCGGYNDAGQTSANIISGIAAFTTLFRSKFPNAKLHLGFIGWSKNSEKIIPLKDAVIAYKKGCVENNIEFMKGCEFAFHNYFNYFASDGIHPNQAGQNSIASALYNCIMTGDANVIENEEMYFNVSGTINGLTIDLVLRDGYITLSKESSALAGITFTNAIEVTGNNLTEIGTLTNSLIIGTNLNSCGIKFSCVIQESGGAYSNQEMILIIKNGKLFLCSPHASGNQYTSVTVKALQIRNIYGIVDALSC